MLVANAVSGTNKQPFNVTATYTNGETKSISVDDLPKATATAASANGNFVADLTTYSRKHRRDTSTDPDTYEWHSDTPAFTEITDSTAAGIALYEYELDLDSSLTLQSIKFDVKKDVSSKTVGIVAITGETVVNEVADVVTATPIVSDGKVTVSAACPVEATLYLAVYDQYKNLIAADSHILTAGDMGEDLVAESEEIAADGIYDIKLFMWSADGALTPLTLPIDLTE
ncbi:MAG: hypothetical protein IJ454_00205 [Clostridia bacterium]|nr:hypothetical protein [Clostridia bacterium]